MNEDRSLYEMSIKVIEQHQYLLRREMEMVDALISKNNLLHQALNDAEKECEGLKKELNEFRNPSLTGRLIANTKALRDVCKKGEGGDA